jgi:hypothetical protein
MVEPKRILQVALALALAACICVAVAVVRRHHFEDAGSIFGIQGAYFSRDVGAPAYAASGPFSYDMFDPLRPLNAYLWLGAAIGLGFSAMVLAIVARVFATGPNSAPA